jgi:type 2 lantibiotic biosynthesis protein LanM
MPFSSPEDSLVKGPQLSFVDLWLPVKERGISQLRTLCAEKHLSIQISDDALDELGQSLLRRLVDIGEQVLWKEFNETRSTGDLLAAHLIAKGSQADSPPRGLYTKFIRRHRKQGIEKLLDKYPVFGRFLGTTWNFWLEASIEMLTRIDKDREAIFDTFGVPMGIAIQNIQQGLSDPHRAGRVVSVITFVTAGSVLKVVYKPKDLNLDKMYQSTLEDLNHHSPLPPLKTIAIHCGDGYGYMEYVPHVLCKNPQELDRFYFNAGRLTTVLHILGCTDCHHQNLIASGEHLVFIDTETLFEDYFHSHVAETAAEVDSSPVSELRRRFHGSVLRSGLIPMWRFIGPQNIAIDMSALGVQPPSDPTRLLPGWLALNCDGMMAGHTEQSVEIATSLPIGIGFKNPFEFYLDRFCDGFREQCAELMAHRPEWIRSGGVLERFSGIPRRFVFRTTRVYSALQRQQLEPIALRSSLNQFIKLEQLARCFLLASERPAHWPIFASEVMQMDQLDIPFFEHPINGKTLPLFGDATGLEYFTETSGLDASLERLTGLDSEAIEFQLRLIRGSCAARVLRETGNGSALSNSFSNRPSPGPVSLSQQEKLLQASCLMRTLLELAIWDRNGDVEWLGTDIGEDGERFSFGPVGLSLYGGSSGVALLCARLARLASSVPLAIDQEILNKTICSILAPIRELVHEESENWRTRWWRDQALGINGCGGVLLMLAGLEKEGWSSPDLGPHELALGLLKGAKAEFLCRDVQLDILGGCAGLIGSLIQLGTSKSLELAIVAGERLVETQHEKGGWTIRGAHSPMLLGFSHGTAGFAAALARLHNVTGERRFLDAARRALTYERQEFDSTQGDWPDLRKSSGVGGSNSGSNGFMTSWCHGAPGIALGRACLWGTALWDEQAEEEVKVGLNTTASMPLLEADHLCCGSFGLAATLRYVGCGPWITNKIDREAWCLRSEQLIESSVARKASQGGQFNCFGVREGNLLMPGFFTGLSGIGLLLTSDAHREALIPQLMASGLLYSES